MTRSSDVKVRTFGAPVNVSSGNDFSNHVGPGIVRAHDQFYLGFASSRVQLGCVGKSL